MAVHENERSPAFGAIARSSIAAMVLLLLGMCASSTRSALSPGVALLSGSALLLFSAFAAHTAFTRRPSSLLLLSLGQLALSVASTSLLMQVSGALPASAGVLAGALAMAQLWALREALRERAPSMGLWHYCLALDARATPEALWRVVGRVGDIARYMPELAESELRDGVAPGVGAVRACRDRSGAAWAEAITRYDAGRLAFDVRFLHEEELFPYPVSVMFGGWRIVARGSGSRVEIWWSLTPSARVFPWMVVALMGLRVDQGMARVVARMDAAALGESVQVHPRPLPVGVC